MGLKLTSRGLHKKLIKSQAFSTGSSDSGAGGFGETKSSNSELGDNQNSLIISDGGDGDDSTGPDAILTIKLLTGPCRGA